MRKRVLLFDPIEYPGGVFGDISVFTSCEAMTDYLGIDSLSGSDLAFVEDGEQLDLIVKNGRIYKNIFGKEKCLPDFKYVEAVPTGDYSQIEIFRTTLISYLTRNVIPISQASTNQQLVDAIVKAVGGYAR